MHRTFFILYSVVYTKITVYLCLFKLLILKHSRDRKQDALIVTATF